MYYWPGMSTDLLRWIETCPKCCTSKAGPGMGRMPLTQELFGVRFARVAVDIITGFVTTPEGNTCMMVVTDYYTKYTKVFPLKDHKAATCARALVKGVSGICGGVAIINSAPSFGHIVGIRGVIATICDSSYSRLVRSARVSRGSCRCRGRSWSGCFRGWSGSGWSGWSGSSWSCCGFSSWCRISLHLNKCSS